MDLYSNCELLMYCWLSWNIYITPLGINSNCDGKHNYICAIPTQFVLFLNRLVKEI